MSSLKSEVQNNIMMIYLSGRIDSGNAPDVEKEITDILDGENVSGVVLDAEDLTYISSAGLRVLLHLRKNYPDLTLKNANTDVYEILDMTGFTQMINVEKAYKTVSIEGCEVIGRGANGTIYRIDQDNVVKVYNNADALSEIQNEREVARLALILGIPTAISYDVVKVGDSYGSVFELLNAKSFAKILKDEPERFHWCVKEYVKLLKTIHGTLVPNGKLGDVKDLVMTWAHIMQDYLPEESGKKLLSLVEAVPPDNHMIHGDYHPKNVELQNDEVLLIDMDTLAVGNPIFELGFIFNAFVGYYEMFPESILDFQGFDLETSHRFWKCFLAEYLSTDDEEKIKAVEEKARVIGYTRLIRRSIRLGGLEKEDTKKEIDLWTGELIDLLNRVDTLLMDEDKEGDLVDKASQQEMELNTLDIEAKVENFDQVSQFINENLEAHDCPLKAMMQIEVVVEEIFTNIAKYAYGDNVGRAKIKIDIQDQKEVEITFMDTGVPYNPLANADPDVTLSAEEREIGGLGIFMSKQMMDHMAYEYSDGMNILRIKKNL